MAIMLYPRISVSSTRKRYKVFCQFSRSLYEGAKIADVLSSCTHLFKLDVREFLRALSLSRQKNLILQL